MTDVKAPLLLYVEDEQLIAIATIDLLQGAGFNVEHFTDGAAAVARLSETEPQPVALVTDIRLPAVNGWEIARRAREQFPAIAVVYVSGDSAVDWSAKGVPESIMLQKPFAEAQLVAAVTTLLNQRPIVVDQQADS